jgi:hypothetical protein
MQPKIALAIGATNDSQRSHVPGLEALRASGHLTRDAAAVRRLHRRAHRRREAHRRHEAHRRRAAHRRHEAHRRREAHRRHEARRHEAQRSIASPTLQAIAACESGGNPSAIGGGGQYRGKYQFSMATWASVGGTGDPATASEAEQDRRASMLYARTGAASWPVCGR